MKNVSKLSLALVVSLGVAGVAKAGEVLKLAVVLDAMQEYLPTLPAKVTETYNKLKELSKKNAELDALIKAKTGEERFQALIERFHNQDTFMEAFISFIQDLNTGLLNPVFTAAQKIPQLRDSLTLTEVKDATGKPLTLNNAVKGLIAAAAKTNTQNDNVVNSIETYAQPKGGAKAGAPAAEMEF